MYENSDATSEFQKASGILGGLWEKVHERPEVFLDGGIVAVEGVDAAARDFLAGMTDRFAVSLYERLFIPKPWVELAGHATVRWRAIHSCYDCGFGVIREGG